MLRYLQTTILAILLCTSVHAQQPQVGKVIYASWAADNKSSELYIINTDGSGTQQLTHNGKQVGQSSTFKDRVVYMQEDSAGVNFFICTVDGKAVKSLHKFNGGCRPKWSPDGRLIAYESASNDNIPEIWVMDSSGNNKRSLVPNARHPYWYADGSKLLFTRDYEVYSKDIKTGKEQQLTHLRVQDYSAKWPAISPDGKKLAFKVYKGTQPMDAKGIMVIDLATGAQKIIPDTDMPYWTSDNHYMLCSRRPRDYAHSQILMVNIDTGEKTPITTNDRSNDFPAWVND